MPAAPKAANELPDRAGPRRPAVRNRSGAFCRNPASSRSRRASPGTKAGTDRPGLKPMMAGGTNWLAGKAPSPGTAETRLAVVDRRAKRPADPDVGERVLGARRRPSATRKWTARPGRSTRRNCFVRRGGRPRSSAWGRRRWRGRGGAPRPTSPRRPGRSRKTAAGDLGRAAPVVLVRLQPQRASPFRHSAIR